MKTRQIIVTSSNSPVTIPLNPRGGPVGVGATPDSATYTVEMTLTPLEDGLTPNTFAITDMTAATTAQSAQIGPVTAVVVTLDSGTSVTMDITQSDV